MGCAVSVMCGVVQIGCLCQWWCRTGWTCRDCRLDLASWASVILWKQWGDSTRHFLFQLGWSEGLCGGIWNSGDDFGQPGGKGPSVLSIGGGHGPLVSFNFRFLTGFLVSFLLCPSISFTSLAVFPGAYLLAGLSI